MGLLPHPALLALPLAVEQGDVSLCEPHRAAGHSGGESVVA